MLMKILLTSLTVLLLHSSAWALTLKGQVLERGTKVPMKDITVYVLPHQLKAETDEKGRFQVDNVPTGEFKFVINVPGYQKLEIEDEQTSEEDNSTRTLFVER